MKKIRRCTYETNSSSTHSLSLMGGCTENYTPPGNKLIIKFVNTNDCCSFTTLREKVSYLVSHIISRYAYDCLNYQDLIEEVSNTYDFKRIKNFVMRKYNKEIVFPEKYVGDIEDIVEINHQLRENSLEGVLESLVRNEKDLLEDVLAEDTIIEMGHD